MFGGSFWMSSASGSSNAQLDALLSAPDVSLQSVLEDEGVIQEAKNENAKLIDFLAQPAVLSELLALVTTEPSEELEASERFKLCNRASEVLLCEVGKLKDEISSNRAHLEVLYRPLKTRDCTLNPLLASFFTKAFGMLLVRKCQQNLYNYHRTYIQVIEFLKEQELVQDIVAHLDTSAIADFLICLLSSVGVLEIKKELLLWLDERRLIESIVERLSAERNRGDHDQAARLIIEIVRVGRANKAAEAGERIDDDPLLAKIQSQQTVQNILEVILNFPEGVSSDSQESSIVNGLTAIQGLLEVSISATSADCPCQSDESRSEIESEQQVLNGIVSAILPYVDKLTDLLKQPPKKNAVQTSCGILQPPLGFTRLHVAKLFNVMLAARIPAVQTALVRSTAINQLLDLFFTYPLNNFLHTTVHQIVSKVALAEHTVDVTSTTSADLESSKFPTECEKEENVVDAQNSEKKEDNSNQEYQQSSLEKSDSMPSCKSPESDEPKRTTDTLTTENKEKSDAVVSAKKEGSEVPTSIKEKTSEEVTVSTNDQTEESESKEDNGKPKDVVDDDRSFLGQTYLVEEGPLNHFFIDHLLVDCRLIERILAADIADARQSSRIAYLGHLRKLANLIVSLTQPQEKSDNDEELSPALQNLPKDLLNKWQAYVEGELKASNLLDIITPPKIFQGMQSVTMAEESDNESQVYSTFCLATDMISTRPNRDSEGDEDDDFDAMDLEEPCRNLDEMSDLFGGVPQTEQVFEALTQLSSGFDAKANQLLKKSIADLPDCDPAKDSRPKARPSTPTMEEDDKMEATDNSNELSREDNLQVAEMDVEDTTVRNDDKMDVADTREKKVDDKVVEERADSKMDGTSINDPNVDEEESFDPEKDAIKDVNPWESKPSTESKASVSNWAAFDTFNSESSEKQSEESWAKFN